MFDSLIFKLLRMVFIMVCASLGTAFVLLGTVANVSMTAVVVGATIVAFIVGIYDFGLLDAELEV